MRLFLSHSVFAILFKLSVPTCLRHLLGYRQAHAIWLFAPLVASFRTDSAQLPQLVASLLPQPAT
jgi:hypothetical protein